MKETVKFLVNITVDGAEYKDGDVVAKSEVPNGCLASLIRLRQVELSNEQPDPPADAPAPASAPKPTAKKTAVAA